MRRGRIEKKNNENESKKESGQKKTKPTENAEITIRFVRQMRSVCTRTWLCSQPLFVAGVVLLSSSSHLTNNMPDGLFNNRTTKLLCSWCKQKRKRKKTASRNQRSRKKHPTELWKTHRIWIFKKDLFFFWGLWWLCYFEKQPKKVLFFHVDFMGHNRKQRRRHLIWRLQSSIVNGSRTKTTRIDNLVSTSSSRWVSVAQTMRRRHPWWTASKTNLI